MIYVVQTIAGREESVARFLSSEREPLHWKTLVPRRKLQHKVKGVWRTEEDVLFKGYVFAVAEGPEGLDAAVRATPYAVRVLGSGEGGPAQALLPEEESLVRFLCGEEGEALGLSQGIADGDRVVVTKGPLVGMESIISRVDRHKRRAFIDVEMLGRTVPVQVDLEVVTKR